MSKENGGPAFPCHTNPRPGTLMNAPQGMTLRDYFAAKFAAAQAVATSADNGFINPGHFDSRNEKTAAQMIAEISYELADAMLLERAK